MSNEYLVKFMKEKCFNTLNEFLKEKSGSKDDIFFIEQKRGAVRFGYVPSGNESPFFEENYFRSDWTAMERAIQLQFCIFEGCKNHGCYEDVPMIGAPEEGDETYFEFEHKGVKYKFILWR